MTTLTIDQRLDQAEAAFNEGRIIQHSWRRPADESGRELVCALAAFGPDINSASDCPADLMPPWVASLIPTLDDGIAAEDVPWFMGELLKRARRWQVLDTAAWERIRIGFMVRSLQQALDTAAKVQPDPAPAYWQPVVDAIGQVQRALQGDGDLGEARKAAAEAAAEAAEAAEARWAARWAAAAAAAEAAARPRPERSAQEARAAAAEPRLRWTSCSLTSRPVPPR